MDPRNPQDAVPNAAAAPDSPAARPPPAPARRPFGSRLLHPRGWSLSAKLGVLLLLAVLLPSGVSAWLNLRSSLSRLEADAHARLELLARSTADRVDETIRADGQAVKVLARDPEVVALLAARAAAAANRPATAPATSPAPPEANDPPALRSSVERTLLNVLASNPDFASAFVLDRDGMAVLSTIPEHAGRNFAFRDYFKQAHGGRTYVSQVLVGVTTNRPGLYYSAPVVSQDGTEVLGVAVVKFEGEGLWAAVDGLRVGRESAAFLVDEDGVVIAHPDRAALYKTVGPATPDQAARINPTVRFQRPNVETLGEPDLAAAVNRAAAAPHATYTAADGARRIAALAPLRNRPWVLVVDVPAAEVRGPLTQLAERHAWTVAGVGACMVVLAVLLGRTMVRPIGRLVAAAGRLEHGDYAGARVGPDGTHPDDDVGRLVRAFDHMVSGLRERERERDIFGRVVSPEVRERLLTGGLELGGETLYVSVLFSDIRGFSTLSERMTPGQVVTFLNEYLTEMAAAVRPFGGYINNFLGDAILVVFGAPGRREDCEGRAVSAALGMRDALSRLNDRRAGRGEERLDSGVGIGSGEVVAGQVGSLERLMYTVIGDAVNVAARLESLTKDYPQYPILVNGPTAKALAGREFAVERVGERQVKGRAGAVEVYAVTGRTAPAGVTDNKL